MTSSLFARITDPNQPAYIVAEVGINHNGSRELARKTVDAAIEAGADAVKFQNFKTEDFVTDPTLTYSYENNGVTKTETLYEMFKRVEMDGDFLADIAGYCTEKGIEWHSTPTNAGGIADVVAAGANVIKNGSDYLGHLPLIRQMAETGLPVVLSTGMATFEDIADAVETALEAGSGEVALLHCTSQYPTPVEEIALKRMGRLAAAFSCPVGFSDHTIGSIAATGSIALGARWIEKHFTFDRTLPGPDHAMSEDPASLGDYIRDIRAMESMLARDSFQLSAKEQEARAAHRLSCCTARDLPEGHVLGAKDIQFARPGSGYAPKHADMLIGRRLARAIKGGALLSAADFS